MNKSKFEKDHADKFLIESLDLGSLTKVHIEHDNSSFKKVYPLILYLSLRLRLLIDYKFPTKNWFLDKIEIKNLATNETTVFPCNRWLSKEKEDGEIGRDLYPEVSERDASKSPRSSFRETRFDDRYDTVPDRATKRNNSDRPIDRTNSLRDDRMTSERMTRDTRSEIFPERGGPKNSIRSERDVTRERERDMYSRSPRRSDYF